MEYNVNFSIPESSPSFHVGNTHSIFEVHCSSQDLAELSVLVLFLQSSRYQSYACDIYLEMAAPIIIAVPMTMY